MHSRRLARHIRFAALRVILRAVVGVVFWSTIGHPMEALAQDRITLRVATWATAEEFALEQRIADAFMERYPQVRIEHESIPSGYREKILASYASGTVPDVFLLDSPIIPALMNRDLLVDLAPFQEWTGRPASAWFPSVQRVFSRGPELLAFPKDFTPVVVYYNRALFREAGVPEPDSGWTWTDFREAARQLTADTDGDGRNDRFGAAVDNKLYLWQPWVWMTGGDLLAPDGKSASGYADSEATEEALQFLIDLYKVDGVSPPIVGSGSDGGGVQGTTGMFYAGRLGMMTSGRWSLVRILPYLRTGELDIGVAPLPTPDDGHHRTVLYAAGWSVSKASPNREWAIRLAAFLASPTAQRMRLESPIGIPSLKEIAEEQASADTFGIERIFLAEADFGRQSWGTRVDGFSRIEDIMERAVDRALVGNDSLGLVLAAAAGEIDALLTAQAGANTRVATLEGDRHILGFLYGTGGVVLLLVALSYITAKRTERRALRAGYAFLTPSFVVLFLFLLVPLVFSLYLSVHQWDIISAEKPFVGLDHFRMLLSDGRFWRAFTNTIVYTLHVPVAMAVSLGIAMLLQSDRRGMAIWRAVFFLPSISSLVAIAMVWQWMYHPEFGLANYTLRLFGIAPQAWLSAPGTALVSLMIVNVWLSVGYQMIIFLAGLKGIPKSYYDAAIVDGAGAWDRFRHITLPLLRPTTLFVLVTSVISSFQVFTLVFVMTEGGPLDATDVVVFHIYRSAYDYLQMGYASAMAWVLFVVLFAITWIQFRLSGRKVRYA